MLSTLIEFANHPEIHEELLKEQEQLNKIDGDSLNELAKMEKLDSLVKEALRIYVEIGGFNISTPFPILTS